jgi:hypothetical protein
MGKQSRNSQRDRGNAPARNDGSPATGPQQGDGSTMEAPSPGSGMQQPSSNKRRKKFGHN